MIDTRQFDWTYENRNVFILKQSQKTSFLVQLSVLSSQRNEKAIPIKQIPELEWDYDLYTAAAVAQMFAKTVVTLRGLRLLGMLYSNISEEYG